MPTFRPFSLRNKQAIAGGKIQIQLLESPKKRLITLLYCKNESYSYQPNPDDNWIANTTVFESAARELWELHADDALEKIVTGEPGDRVADLRKFLLQANDYHVLDFIELFVRHDELKGNVVDKVNATMAEEGIPWKLLDLAFEQTMPPIPRRIRQEITDRIKLITTEWHGALDELGFVARFIDLETLPSEDPRHKTFTGDHWQHRENNDDWPDDWIYSDSRIDLLGCDERRFIRFLEAVVNPDIRTDPKVLKTLSDRIGSSLEKCGYRLDREEVKVGSFKFSVAHGVSSAKSMAGGFGLVRRVQYKGHDVAMKTLKPELRNDFEAVQRFRHEVDCLKRLKDLPSVVALMFDKIDGDEFAYAMEWCDFNLDDYLTRSPTMPLDQRHALVRGMLVALDAIHGRGIIHRDLCPYNLLVKDHKIKVSDFGLARDQTNAQALTRSSVSFGKDGYMAPELNDGFIHASELSDIYALGKIMHQVLEGKSPHEEPSGFYAHIISRSTHSSKDRRYPNVKGMLEDFDQHHQLRGAADTFGSLADVVVEVKQGATIDFRKVHQLIVTCSEDSTYVEFWDPLMDLMQGSFLVGYAEWAGDGGRLVEYVGACERMWEALPSVGWTYDNIGLMCQAAIAPVSLGGTEEAIIRVFEFLWPIAFVSDRWHVQRLLFDSMGTPKFRENQTLVGHAVRLVGEHGLKFNKRSGDLSRLPQQVRAAVRHWEQESMRKLAEEDG